MVKGGYGALLGFEFGRDAGRRFIDNLKMLYHVANIGDARSLAIHRATTTAFSSGYDIKESAQQPMRHPWLGGLRGLTMYLATVDCASSNPSAQATVQFAEHLTDKLPDLSQRMACRNPRLRRYIRKQPAPILCRRYGSARMVVSVRGKSTTKQCPRQSGADCCNFVFRSWPGKRQCTFVDSHRLVFPGKRQAFIRRSGKRECQNVAVVKHP